MKKFEEVEIRSVVMGIGVVITQKMIVKLLRTSNFGRFVVGTKDNTEADAIKLCLFKKR